MIDFTFTEEKEMFRKAAREVAETKIVPKVAEMEETGEVSDDVVKALAETEMMAITIPEEYGGLGLGYTARMIAVEEISRVSVAAGMMCLMVASPSITGMFTSRVTTSGFNSGINSRALRPCSASPTTLS